METVLAECSQLERNTGLGGLGGLGSLGGLGGLPLALLTF